MRPPRAHHCSKCGQCSLRLDHHCAFMGVCVGARNYKAFCLFLLHAFILSSTMILASYAYWHWGNGEASERHWAVSCFFWTENVALCLGELFVGAMVFVHCLLVAVNVTSLERKKGAALYFPGTNPTEQVPLTQHNPYDLGPDQNFVSVFGANPFLVFWPYPDDSQLQGSRFPTCPPP